MAMMKYKNDLRECPVTLGDLRRILRRRHGLWLACVVLCITVGVLLCIFSTRRYEATGEIQVQKDSADALGLDSMMGGAAEASDALDANITLQTQADLLQSDTMALQAIESLGLEQAKDFRSRFNPLGWMLGKMLPAGPPDAVGALLEFAPRRRTRALKVFTSHLSVKVVSGTRLIEIHFVSSDPALAARVVNQLMRGLADYTFQTRFAATTQASVWLTGQLAQGRDQAYSVTVDRLQQAAATLSQATSNRILKGAVYKIVQSGNAELISGLSANGIANGSPTMTTSLGLIQSLRLQEATLETQIAEGDAKYGAHYPRLAEQRASLAGMERTIQEEVKRVAERSKNDYAVARQAEDESRREFSAEKRDADRLNDKAIEYAIVRQEADDSRSLYDDLLKRLKEAGVLEGLRSSNITVVDPGRTPSTPKQPNIPVYLGISIGAGLLFGTCAAFVMDSVDDKIQSAEEIEQDLGATPLGILPYLGEPGWYKTYTSRVSRLSANSRTARAGVDALAIFAHPSSPYTESLRSLRTVLLLAKTCQPPQVILVTSPFAGDGKSILSSNLAAVFAQAGKRVLLLDADLLRPSLSGLLEMKSHVGLSQLLTNQHVLEDMVAIPSLPNMHLLTAGPPPPFPVELLSSSRMVEVLQRWRSDYDFIVIDSPPVLPVTDAVVLSGLADTTLLVARYGVTNRLSLARSHRMLRDQSSRERVGIVLNGVSQGSSFHYEYYGYTGALTYAGIQEGSDANA